MAIFRVLYEWKLGTRNKEIQIFKTSASHVTSELNISYARGAWNFGMTCLTGKSAYGTSFSTNGIGHTYGGIQRYWWWTGGGSAPFNWKFTLGRASLEVKQTEVSVFANHN